MADSSTTENKLNAPWLYLATDDLTTHKIGQSWQGAVKGCLKISDLVGKLAFTAWNAVNCDPVCCSPNGDDQPDSRR
jgi:hypothetical protein